eukprot:234790_1
MIKYMQLKKEQKLIENTIEKHIEKRLDNISRLMDYNTCLYIRVNDNDNDNDMKMNDNQMVTEYNNIQQQIDDELKAVSQQVEQANKSLTDPNVFNPYIRLRLTTLYDQLSQSQKPKFQRLWDNIHDEIINAIRNVLNGIKQRNNQIQMQTEYNGIQTKVNMTYSQQETCLRKIELSLSSFPIAMKETIQTMLKETKE